MIFACSYVKPSQLSTETSAVHGKERNSVKAGIRLNRIHSGWKLSLWISHFLVIGVFLRSQSDLLHLLSGRQLPEKNGFQRCQVSLCQIIPTYLAGARSRSSEVHEGSLYHRGSTNYAISTVLTRSSVSSYLCSVFHIVPYPHGILSIFSYSTTSLRIVPNKNHHWPSTSFYVKYYLH